MSIFLIALGAILTWGVTAEAEGIDIGVVGVILMLVGLLGLVLSMLFWSSWGGFGRRRTVAYDEDYPVRHVSRVAPRRTTVIDERDDAPPL